MQNAGFIYYKAPSLKFKSIKLYIDSVELKSLYREPKARKIIKNAGCRNFMQRKSSMKVLKVSSTKRAR